MQCMHNVVYTTLANFITEEILAQSNWQCTFSTTGSLVDKVQLTRYD